MSTAIKSSPPTGFPAMILKSSVGRKFLVAITGFVAYGFVFGHMAGNLQVFIGQDQYNTYAASLQALGPLLWVIRLVVLSAFVAHVWLTILLKLENWSARPVSYENETTQQATLASRTMIWTGLIIFSFLVYHLLHYTIRVTNPEYNSLADSLGRPDVYTMVIMGFSNKLVSVMYMISVGLLAYHVSHGFSSMFQSLGLNSPKWQVRLDRMATALAWLLFIGYASVPSAIMFGCPLLDLGGN